MSKQDVSPEQPEAGNEARNETGAGNEDLSIEELQQKLAEAEARAGEYREQLLRAVAEQENLQRRHVREVENAHKYALEHFAQELLPVIDSLEMGVEAANTKGASVEKLREGTELTLKMLLAAMEKFGIAAIHPEGEPFDPELHQAMSLLESPEHAPNTVMNVMQKGYTLNERLIRPAMVVVSKAGEKKPDEEKQEY